MKRASSGKKKLSTMMRNDVLIALRMCAAKQGMQISDLIEGAVVEYLRSKTHCREFLKSDIEKSEVSGDE